MISISRVSDADEVRDTKKIQLLLDFTLKKKNTTNDPYRVFKPLPETNFTISGQFDVGEKTLKLNLPAS
ncbi:MAG: hypothetical protein MK033_10400 [Candidatus Caenarcaniphilales bacterium]|nr:hypothetical protein [Candidatus Caenarcaniphilales bacterium]